MKSKENLSPNNEQKLASDDENPWQKMADEVLNNNEQQVNVNNPDHIREACSKDNFKKDEQNLPEHNEGDNMYQEVYTLFETDYNGEKEFGPQGLVDYWTKLKDDLTKTQTDDSNEQSDKINKKMRIVRKYLEKEVWGDKLVNETSFDLIFSKEDTESLINSGVDAEALYSKVLMGERNIAWADGDLESSKYGSGLDGKSTINYVGTDILVSSDFLPLMESQGVNIDGNDILARTIHDPSIIANNAETLCRYGADIDVLMSKIQDYPYVIASKLGVLLSAGARINVDDLVVSLNDYQKIGCLKNLCEHGGKINISELIESTWQEAEEKDKGKDINDGWIDNRHILIHELMREAKTVVEYGGRDAIDTLRNKLKTLELNDDEAKLLTEIPDEKIDEFGLSDEDKKRRSKKWGEINVTEADKEKVKNSNFNGIDVGLDINKPADPDAEDKMNYYLKTFCNFDSSGCVWNKSNLSERKRICTEMTTLLKERIGITMEARIVFSKLKDNHGGHMGPTKEGRGWEIAINSKYLEKMGSLYAIEVIAHETWHFYQFQCAFSDPPSDMGKIYNKNLNHYIDMDIDEEKYMNQPLEEEAYRFGRMFRDYVKKLETKLNNDDCIKET